MANNSTNLWSNFLNALSVVGINISLDNFKLASGLQIANWQLVDYTGINMDYTGQISVSNLFNTADPMPSFNDFSYIPGSSFYDQYAAYVNAIKTTVPPDITLSDAKTRLYNSKMGVSPNAYPGYSIVPDLNVFLQSSLQNTFNTPKLNFTMSLAPDSATNKSTARSTNDNKLPSFIQLSKKGETINKISSLDTTNTSKKAMKTQEATLEFTAQNIQTFRVTPDRWFNSAMITNYYDKIDPNSALGNKELFGENGVLNNRVVTILVVFKRTVVITASKEQLENLHDANYLNTSENSVDIGGFTFKGGDATDFTKETNSYTYTDNSNAPYIMGYQVVNLGPSTG